MSELDLLQWIHTLSSPSMDSLMLGVTYAATHAAVWLILAALMMCVKKYRKTGMAVIVSVAVAYIICDIVLKNLVSRDRPCDLAGFDLLVSVPETYSFPSGHTMSSFAAATAIYFFHRREGAIAMVFAALVGFSRLYLFVHWPTDVIAGAVLGIVVAYVVVIFMDRRIPAFRSPGDGDA